jgi:octaprenyl-diphosphate synthase
MPNQEIQIEEFLAETGVLSEEAIDKYLKKKEFEHLRPLLEYSNNTGGKRLRPALSRLVSLSLGGPDHETVRLASGCELIHQASLAHDDIIDGDNYRRGKETLHTVFGVGQAVMAGDLLVMLAFRIGFNKNVEFGTLLIDTFNSLIRGNALEIVPGRDKFDRAFYNEIISGKTASMFAAPCKLGAIIAGADEEVKNSIYEFGHSIGMMYQIADDLSDVLRFLKTGEPAGDIANRTVTLPIIVLHEELLGENAKLLDRFANGFEFEETDYEWLKTLLNSSDAIAYTYEQLELYRDKASESLHVLPEGVYKDALQRIPDFMIDAILKDVEVILETATLTPKD